MSYTLDSLPERIFQVKYILMQEDCLHRVVIYEPEVESDRIFVSVRIDFSVRSDGF
jgi:hypothetical protein